MPPYKWFAPSLMAKLYPFPFKENSPLAIRLAQRPVMHQKQAEAIAYSSSLEKPCTISSNYPLLSVVNMEVIILT